VVRAFRTVKSVKDLIWGGGGKSDKSVPDRFLDVGSFNELAEDCNNDFEERSALLKPSKYSVSLCWISCEGETA
jgi:hypothetical protein